MKKVKIFQKKSFWIRFYLKNYEFTGAEAPWGELVLLWHLYAKYSLVNSSCFFNCFSKELSCEVLVNILSVGDLIDVVAVLLRNHHVYQQQEPQQAVNAGDSNNQLLLTRLFYLLIDLYEAQMHHPNDILNSLNNSILRRRPMDQEQENKDWSLLIQTNNSIDPYSTLTEQHMASDSIHLYMFDLIHLIGTNFIQTNSGATNSLSFQRLRKRNQQILLEKIIQKLTMTVQPSAASLEPSHQQFHLSSSRNNSNSSLAR